MNLIAESNPCRSGPKPSPDRCNLPTALLQALSCDNQLIGSYTQSSAALHGLQSEPNIHLLQEVVRPPLHGPTCRGLEDGGQKQLGGCSIARMARADLLMGVKDQRRSAEAVVGRPWAQVPTSSTTLSGLRPFRACTDMGLKLPRASTTTSHLICLLSCASHMRA